MKRWAAVALALMNGCAGDSGGGSGASDLILKTSDGLEIAATLRSPTASTPPGLVLVHQVGGDRLDWNALVEEAFREGYATVAIDMRGHGDSAALNPDSPKYRSFSAEDWEGVLYDIDAAKQALLKAGVDGNRIGVVGASIGANLAARYAAEHEDVAALVLISPGSEYKGVRIGPAFEAYGRRPSLLVTGEGDSYSAKTCRSLHESAEGFCELREFSGTYHGAALLDSSPNVTGQILQWCDTVLANAAEPSPMR